MLLGYECHGEAIGNYVFGRKVVEFNMALFCGDRWPGYPGKRGASLFALRCSQVLTPL